MIRSGFEITSTHIGLLGFAFALRNLRGVSCALSLLPAALMLCISFASAADDYRLHPAPTQPAGSGAVDIAYDKPDDPQVCGLYLKNLRYWAQSNTPMSCERPVAPALQDRIRVVEWEDLEPVQYKELFEALVSAISHGRDKNAEAIEHRVGEVKRKEYVFRRARLSLREFPATLNEAASKSQGRAFHIVQFGANVTDPKNPHPVWRCTVRRGGPVQDQTGYLKLYVVSQDLRKVIGPLNNPNNGGTGEHMRLIDRRPYVETAFRNGTVNLMQIRVQSPVILQSVCLYTFKQLNEKR